MIQTSATDTFMLQATSLHATDTYLQIMVHTPYIDSSKNLLYSAEKTHEGLFSAELKPGGC